MSPTARNSPSQEHRARHRHPESMFKPCLIRAMRCFERSSQLSAVYFPTGKAIFQLSDSRKLAVTIAVIQHCRLGRVLQSVSCPSRWSSFETASLRKRRSAALRSRRASIAHCAAGRPARKITGSASAVIRGVHSTRERYAPRAFTSGLRLSASLAADRRRIRTGMSVIERSATFLGREPSPATL